MRSHWSEGLYPLQPEDEWGESGCRLEHREGGREEGARDGERGTERKERDGGRGIVQIPDLDRPGTDAPRETWLCHLGLCLGPRDLFLLPRPPRVLCLRTAPGHRSKETGWTKDGKSCFPFGSRDTDLSPVSCGSCCIHRPWLLRRSLSQMSGWQHWTITPPRPAPCCLPI